VTSDGNTPAVLAAVPSIALLSGGVSRSELEKAGAQSIFDNAIDLCEDLDSTPIGVGHHRAGLVNQRSG
jgi:hypothetical protein